MCLTLLHYSLYSFVTVTIILHLKVLYQKRNYNSTLKSTVPKTEYLSTENIDFMGHSPYNPDLGTE